MGSYWILFRYGFAKGKAIKRALTLLIRTSGFFFHFFILSNTRMLFIRFASDELKTYSGDSCLYVLNLCLEAQIQIQAIDIA